MTGAEIAASVPACARPDAELHRRGRSALGADPATLEQVRHRLAPNRAGVASVLRKQRRMGRSGQVLPLARWRSKTDTYARPLREGAALSLSGDFRGPAAHAPRDRILAGRQHRALFPADRRILRPPHIGGAGDRRRYRGDQAHRPRSGPRARADAGRDRQGPEGSELSDGHVKGPEQVRRTKGPRYTPVSKRQDKPDGIAWIIRNHPEVSDGQISMLIGTTRTTIAAIRDRTHWNIANITPKDSGHARPHQPARTGRGRRQGGQGGGDRGAGRYEAGGRSRGPDLAAPPRARACRPRAPAGRHQPAFRCRCALRQEGVSA